MGSSQPLLLLGLQLIVAALAGWICLAGWRFIARSSGPLGLVVGLGIVARALAGVAMFTVSYLDLPLLASLHSGDGFWELAPDARVYYRLAADAGSGLAVPAGSPSPSFVEALGLWLRLTGYTPVSAVLFNLTLYVAACVLLTIAFGALSDVVVRRAALITISAVSFSPLLVLLSTQPLKDVFSVFLTSLAGCGAALMLRVARHPLHVRGVLGLAAIALAVYLMSGVRAYYAMFICAAAAVAFIVATCVSARGARWRCAASGAVVLFVLWGAFKAGAGPYYAFYGNLVTRTLGVQLTFISPDSAAVAALPPTGGEGIGAATNTVRALRSGFVRSGGGTNIASSTGLELGAHIRALLVGLAALFLPISMLIQLSVVEFSGGRGFLLVTDLDTLFLDAMLAAVAWVVIRKGSRLRRDWPFLGFALTLGLVSAVLMAYIVTNYGTVVRLRLLAAVPLWLVPLALVHRRALADVPTPSPAGEGEAEAPLTTPAVALRGGKA